MTGSEIYGTGNGTVFVAYSCKFSRRYVWPIVLDATKQLFPQFVTVTLKLGQGQKFCSKMVVQAKIFGYTKFCLATLKTPSLRSIRVWRKKNGNSGYLNPSNQLRWFVLIISIMVATKYSPQRKSRAKQKKVHTGQQGGVFAYYRLYARPSSTGIIENDYNASQYSHRKSSRWNLSPLR